MPRRPQLTNPLSYWKASIPLRSLPVLCIDFSKHLGGVAVICSLHYSVIKHFLPCKLVHPRQSLPISWHLEWLTAFPVLTITDAS